MNGESQNHESQSHEPQAPAPAPASPVDNAPAAMPQAEIVFVSEVPATPAATSCCSATPAAEPVAVAMVTEVVTAPTPRTRAKKPKASDLIEQTIVIRRDRWESLMSLTDTLHDERAVKADPSEVAAIVLEAGLAAILEEARATKAAAAKKPAVKKMVKAAKPTKTAPTTAVKVAARKFRPAELKEIHGLVHGLKSDRAIQRTLALWLGAHSKKGSVAVPIEDLRFLCREAKIYDTANFAQNMKKDKAYFAEVRDKKGDRLGYNLTAAGVKATEALHAAAH